MPPKPLAELFENITANYRFIPFDREVAPAPVRLPDDPPLTSDGEADTRPAISYGIPVPGGYTGTISMHWVARTPVLFGGEQQSQITLPHKLHGGAHAPYCIPGSAQRGMIRRLLRIATKGKVGAIGDTRPALREPTYQLTRVSPNERYMAPPEAGWLCFDADAETWSIKPCVATPIAHTDPAIAELRLAQSTEKSVATLHARLTADICAAVRATYGGYLILSGAMPPKRDGTPSKTHEFVFGEPLDSPPITVDADVLLAFRQAYGKMDSRKKQPKLVPDSNLLHWLAHSLYDQAIAPRCRAAMAACFDVAIHEKGAKLRPDHPPGIAIWYYPATQERPMIIGMSQIMRFPARHTVGEILDRTQPERNAFGHDWADAMLGYVDGDKGQRGRINVAFAPVVGETDLFPSGNHYVALTMMEPRVGFAGLYLRRDGTEGKPHEWEAATYDSETAIAAGRKTYPIWTDWPREIFWDSVRAAPNAGHGGTTSYVKFLAIGTVFETRIDVHNLLPEELGALLWVLSLGDATAFADFDPTEKCHHPFTGLAAMCHSAGRARSFGFGNLIPAGIRLDEVLCHDHAGQADVPLPDWQALIAAFARSVHAVTPRDAADDAAAVAALNSVPRLARLRHLSNRQRDAELSGLRWPPGGNAQFKDYRRLREAASGKPNRDYEATLAATPTNGLGGNILDYGSDSD